MQKKFDQVDLVGVDYWGKKWEYSQELCQKNAEIDGVAVRVKFMKASAAKLIFPDESFDAVVSNLVFHEVKDVKDKKVLIKEALRVLKKGGIFVFQDLFLWKQIYGSPDELTATIRSWGVEKVDLINTSNAVFIPKVLKLPFMAGTLGIIYGKK